MLQGAFFRTCKELEHHRRHEQSIALMKMARYAETATLICRQQYITLGKLAM